MIALLVLHFIVFLQFFQLFSSAFFAPVCGLSIFSTCAVTLTLPFAAICIFISNTSSPLFDELALLKTPPILPRSTHRTNLSPLFASFPSLPIPYLASGPARFSFAFSTVFQQLENSTSGRQTLILKCSTVQNF